ncbi:DEAD/DEAH box helicase [Candidatus Pacearchaeota archaeon]|nr:DEAD/DEAH box helicase [Candidatus Pacearchaeota archaeon]
MEKFRKLGLIEPILKVIEEEKFEEPTEIQEKSIPIILEGRDVIAGSATGSGKTLAFGAGIITNCVRGKGLQALVLTPTRELAEQVSKSLKNFSKHQMLEIAVVYGGVSINPQMEDLETADVVVGTPGRILDHIERGSINFENIHILVLDEADRMLDMGFIDDVKKIISECPAKRQTMLFSATISPDVIRLSSRYMNNPEEVSAESYVDPSKLKQVYYDIPNNEKFSLLVHLLENEKAKLAMVFCNTRKNTDFVANNLKYAGIDAIAIHGGLSQDKRTRIMHQFHAQKVFVLVCTDVAARGLDIKGVSHVYNYDIPKDSKEYIHRIGRTARAGEEGKAVSLLSNRDYENFDKVLKSSEIKIDSEKNPEFKIFRIKWIPKERSEGRGFGGRSGGRRFGGGGYGGRSSGRRFGGRSSEDGGRSYGRGDGESGERKSYGRSGDRFGRSGDRFGRSGDRKESPRGRRQWWGDNRGRSSRR